MREIKRYQINVELLIPKALFAKLVKEIIEEIRKPGFRIQKIAFEVIQEVYEQVLTIELVNKFLIL